MSQFSIYAIYYCSNTKINMEGPIPTTSGVKRTLDSPLSKDNTPNKKSNFVQMSPFGQLTNVKTPTDRPFRLSVEGNIGAGKTEFINYFKNLPGIQVYPVIKTFP